jgi:hypothetical protein
LGSLELTLETLSLLERAPLSVNRFKVAHHTILVGINC